MILNARLPPSPSGLRCRMRQSGRACAMSGRNSAREWFRRRRCRAFVLLAGATLSRFEAGGDMTIIPGDADVGRTRLLLDGGMMISKEI